MAKIKKRGRLVAGVSADSYLLGARDPLGGQIQGFDIDFVKAMAKAILGDERRYQLVVITAAQRIPALESGQVDLVARNMTMTCDRWKQIAFSSEYYRAGQKIMVRAESKATTLADLAGQRVCAPNGTSSMDNLRARQPDAVAVGSDSHTGCLVLFQQGKVDAITGDDTVLAGLAAQDPYAVVPEQKAFTAEPYGLGMNAKNVDLVRFVNARLAQMRADGEWKTIYDRWFAEPLGPAPSPPRAVYGRAAMTGPTTTHHVPAGLAAPPAPGRLGEALEPEAALAYLTALGDWLAARRAELDALDREVLASAEPVRLTGDVTLAMALWQAVADREAQLRGGLGLRTGRPRRARTDGDAGLGPARHPGPGRRRSRGQPSRAVGARGLPAERRRRGRAAGTPRARPVGRADQRPRRRAAGAARTAARPDRPRAGRTATDAGRAARGHAGRPARRRGRQGRPRR